MHSNNSFDELFFHLFRLMKHRMSEEKLSLDLTMYQIYVLFFMSQHKETHMKALADYLQIEMSTATSMVDKLVALRLVKRQNDKKDRRLVYINLTRTGNDIVTEAIEKRRKKISEMLSLLSETQRNDFSIIMRTLISNLEKDYEK